VILINSYWRESVKQPKWGARLIITNAAIYEVVCKVLGEVCRGHTENPAVQ
jgi:hypothetical protein